ncbi:MAG: hypothetical protein IKG46_10930 [Solobacterium sp.]|nr:hypothetical protein [Solobacterium sp.]
MGTLKGILDPAIYWIPLAILAFSCPVFSIVRFYNKQYRGWQLLTFLSLIFGTLVMLEEYLMVNNWVLAEDYKTLKNTVPGMALLLVVFVLFGIALNVYNWYIHQKEIIERRGKRGRNGNV